MIESVVDNVSAKQSRYDLSLPSSTQGAGKERDEPRISGIPNGQLFSPAKSQKLGDTRRTGTPGPIFDSKISLSTRLRSVLPPGRANPRGPVLSSAPTWAVAPRQTSESRTNRRAWRCRDSIKLLLKVGPAQNRLGIGRGKWAHRPSVTPDQRRHGELQASVGRCRAQRPKRDGHSVPIMQVMCCKETKGPIKCAHALVVRGAESGGSIRGYIGLTRVALSDGESLVRSAW